MKKCRYLYFILWSIAILSLIVTFILIARMPETVPMHRNFAGEIDRYGSKYENLIIGVLPCIFALFFAMVGKYENKTKEYKNETILLIIGIFILLCFGIYICLDMYSNVNVNYNFNFSKATSIFIGVIQIMLSIVLPLTAKNSLIGIRTRWSITNDLVWAKSQVAGSIIFGVSGILILLLGIFINTVTSIYFSLIIIIISAILLYIITYLIDKNNR